MGRHGRAVRGGGVLRWVRWSAAGLAVATLACDGVTVDALEGPGACFAQNDLPEETALAADEFVESVGMKVTGGTVSDPVVRERLAELGVRGLLLNDRVEPEEARTLASGLGLRGLVFVEDVERAPAALAFFGPSATSIAFRHSDETVPAGWGDKIRGLQQRLFALVKDDPATRHIQVVGPNVENDEQLAAVGDLSPWVDAGTMFPWRTAEYPLSPGPRAEGDLARHAPVFPGRPMIVEQVGIRVGGDDGVSESVQAKYLLRMWLEHFRLDIRRTYFAELSDSSASVTPDMSQLGLIRADGSLRPGFTALARLLALLTDRGPAFAPARLGLRITAPSATVHHLLLQKRNGVFLLALWREVDSTDADVAEPVAISLSTPARSLTLFTPIASSGPVRHTSGRELNLPVSDGLTVVEIELDCR